MAKTLTIKDPVSGENYTLEYTRKSVEIMEKQGFVAEEVDRKPTVSYTHLDVYKRQVCRAV